MNHMKLVIVESPKKCDTIARYLGSDYRVMASKGHIRELATSGKGGLGIDINNGFLPTYIISKENNKRETVEELRSEAKKADEVLLATDPDREGEAIAWHLTQVLSLDPKTTKRLRFHEITRESITEAIENPSTIDMNLVASQETRRIIDRIIGFKLSSLLQKKLNSRSAGRVQSATLKIICDHQKEIDAFVPEEYWTIDLDVKSGLKELSLSLDKIDGANARISTKDEDAKIVSLIPTKLALTSIEKRQRKIQSKPPFTTSTMQQEAFNVYHFTTQRTSSLAQRLYEGVDVGGEHVGLITYMRTDSTRLSNTFVQRARAFINEKFGEKYVGSAKNEIISTLGQDAHEAIRPTSNHRTPASVRPYLTNEQYKLYKLIYNRALASLMPEKIEEVTTVLFVNNGMQFKTEGVRTQFDGFEVLYGNSSEDVDKSLPNILLNEVYDVVKINDVQHFTKPPAIYSEAKIVKLMEELGIGRPSTYASTIKTIANHSYVFDNRGELIPTEQGMRTAHVLDKYFPEFVDAKYTARMEADLDNVQDGSESRTQMITDFYYPFMKKVDQIDSQMYKDPEEKTGEMCPKCGSPLVVKKGKYGKFIACSAFPQCDYIKKEKEEPVYTGEKCPKCGMPLVVRKDKKGKTFVGCSGYPSCTYIKGNEEKKANPQIVKKCPKCGGYLVIKKSRKSDFLGCTNFPRCRYCEPLPKKEDNN